MAGKGGGSGVARGASIGSGTALHMLSAESSGTDGDGRARDRAGDGGSIKFTAFRTDPAAAEQRARGEAGKGAHTPMQTHAERGG